MTIYDAIIIGAGHNGLVTAALLAQAGQKVLVLEQRPVLGGVAATEAIFPGFHINIGSPEASLFRPEIIKQLNLDKHGLAFIDSPVVACALQKDAPPLTLWQDSAQSQAEIARFSQDDAAAFPDFVEAVDHITGLVDALSLQIPPSLIQNELAQLLPWFQKHLHLTNLEPKFFSQFLQILPLSIKEFLDSYFESPALKGLLATAGISGSIRGPYAPWSATLFFYHCLGQTGLGFRNFRAVQGGVGQLSQSLAQAAQAHGAEVQTGVAVKRILVNGDDCVQGVLLADGAEIKASTIISNASPHHTFFSLVGPQYFAMKFVRQVKNIRYQGCTVKLNLALSELPQFRPSIQPSALSGRIIISPSINYLERAADATKYGRISTQPYLALTIPTLLDPSLAPAGKHILSVNMQYAPYHLKKGSWPEQEPALCKLILNTLSDYIPNLKDIVRQKQLISPLAWEQTYALPEGHIYHGQMEMDQLLFMRPMGGFAQYHTPIGGLYLCGASTHPGGGVTGAPGYNAAQAILKKAGQEA